MVVVTLVWPGARKSGEVAWGVVMVVTLMWLRACKIVWGDNGVSHIWYGQVHAKVVE